MGKDYFLDCGANVGQSVLHYISTGLITPDTEVHLFEPNKLCIERAKDNLSEYDNYNFTFHTVALWDSNCVKELTLEYAPADYDDQYGSGKTIKGEEWIGGASNILGDDWTPPTYIKEEYIKRGEPVQCIDFAEFLLDTIPEDASSVYMKMDIEGAEYTVLDHLVKTETICLVDKIVDMEWHDCHVDTSLDPTEFGETVCKQVNDLFYETMLVHPVLTSVGNWASHINVSSSHVKFAFIREFLVYTYTEEKLDLPNNDYEWFTSTSYDTVRERLMPSPEEEKA